MFSNLPTAAPFSLDHRDTSSALYRRSVDPARTSHWTCVATHLAGALVPSWPSAGGGDLALPARRSRTPAAYRGDRRAARRAASGGSPASAIS